jgi:hypothetical protein
VTTILAPFADFSGIREDVLENAARRGTEVHRICAALVMGLWVPKVPEDCGGYVQSFRRWLPLVKDAALVEGELQDRERGYCGHPDLVVTIKGDPRPAVIDLKTPQSFSRSWRLQVAAYRNLCRVNGYDVKRCMTLRLKKDGSGVIVNESTDTADHDFNIFCNALAAWKFFNDK